MSLSTPAEYRAFVDDAAVAIASGTVAPASADVCIEDAYACLNRGSYAAAATRALRAVQYAHGAFSILYRTLEWRHRP